MLTDAFAHKLIAHSGGHFIFFYLVLAWGNIVMMGKLDIKLGLDFNEYQMDKN